MDCIIDTVCLYSIVGRFSYEEKSQSLMCLVLCDRPTCETSSLKNESKEL